MPATSDMMMKLTGPGFNRLHLTMELTSQSIQIDIYAVKRNLYLTLAGV